MLNKIIFSAVSIFLSTCLFFSGLLVFVQAQESQSLLYENKEIGITLKGPTGWYRTEGDGVSFLVYFSKYSPDSRIEFNPNIYLTLMPTDDLFGSSDSNKTPLEAVKLYVKDKYNVINAPAVVTVNGREGANCVLGIEELETKTKVKECVYSFIKDDILYFLIFNDKMDDYDKDIKAFEEVVNTFVLK